MTKSLQEILKSKNLLLENAFLKKIGDCLTINIESNNKVLNVKDVNKIENIIYKNKAFLLKQFNAEYIEINAF